MEVEERKPAAGMAMSDDGFTEADLAVADQLVQLSVSGGECEKDGCDSSSPSTTLSVNNAMAREVQAAADDDDMGIDRRVRKRSRLLSELYAATRPVKENGGGGKRKKREEEIGKKKKQPQR